MQFNLTDTTVFLSTTFIDMRKAIDGLVALIVTETGQSPLSGHVYVFYNRQKDKVKCLWWDKNGFILCYKRLEKGRFRIPNHLPEEGITLTTAQLEWLVAGLDFMLMQEFNELNYTNYF